MKKEYNILFIGNSYTFVNDMNIILENIALSAGIKIHTERVTRGGARLDGWANHNTESGKLVQEQLNKHYDFVFLQEQSNLPVVLKDKFFQSVRSLNEDIKKTNAKTVLYETWAKKEGHEALTKYNMTVREMERDMFSAYEEIGEEIDALVSKVGRCFKWCIDNNSYNCYSTDLSHPSKIGSFLGALMHFKTLFGSLDNVSYTYEFDNKTLEDLKNIVNLIK